MIGVVRDQQIDGQERDVETDQEAGTTEEPDPDPTDDPDQHTERRSADVAVAPGRHLCDEQCRQNAKQRVGRDRRASLKPTAVHPSGPS